MGTSERRRKQRAEKKAKKVSRMKNPGLESKYSLKVRGTYSPRSPYSTGDWGPQMKKLRQPTVIQPTPIRDWRQTPNARALGYL